MPAAAFADRTRMAPADSRTTRRTLANPRALRLAFARGPVPPDHGDNDHSNVRSLLCSFLPRSGRSTFGVLTTGALSVAHIPRPESPTTTLTAAEPLSWSHSAYSRSRSRSPTAESCGLRVTVAMTPTSAAGGQLAPGATSAACDATLTTSSRRTIVTTASTSLVVNDGARSARTRLISFSHDGNAAAELCPVSHCNGAMSRTLRDP